MAENKKSNELHLTRLYDAPVPMVWEAWTDPAQAAHWWGPRGFTITTHSKSLKVGGIWHYTMHGPDGVDYPNKTVYLEVEKHKKLVYDHGGYDDRPPLFRVTVTFKPVAQKTQMDMIMTWPNAEIAAEMKKFIKTVGGNGTWDRLAEYLGKETASEELFVLNRSFEVPVETLFEMWSNPDHFSKWLGGGNFSMQCLEGKIAQGQAALFKLNFHEGGLVMYQKMTYQKLEKPVYLEYVQITCDEKGQLAKHPMMPAWPAHMLTRIVFASEGDSQSRLTMTWSAQGDVTAAEMQAFKEMKTSMSQGWTASFDKLEELAEGKKV